MAQRAHSRGTNTKGPTGGAQDNSKAQRGATQKGPVARTINIHKGAGARTNQQSLERLQEPGFRFASQGLEELWSARGRSGGKLEPVKDSWLDLKKFVAGFRVNSLEQE